jgi:hypothetical protein
LRSDRKMQRIRGEFKRRWKIGSHYDDLKIRGERRISRWVDDTFFSVDGRFAVVSRNEHVEHNTPARLRFGSEHMDRVELWADGTIVAECTSLNLAINWLLLKIGTLNMRQASV